MHKPTLGQSPFCGLDRAAQPPSLRYADDLFLRDAGLHQGIQDPADAGRVNANLVQQSFLFDLGSDLRNLLNVIAHAINEDQVAVLREIAESSRFRLAPLKYRRMSPCAMPRHPFARLGIAPDHREAEQVVKPAAVNSDINNVAAGQDVG